MAFSPMLSTNRSDSLFSTVYGPPLYPAFVHAPSYAPRYPTIDLTLPTSPTESPSSRENNVNFNKSTPPDTPSRVPSAANRHHLAPIECPSPVKAHLSTYTDSDGHTIKWHAQRLHDYLSGHDNVYPHVTALPLPIEIDFDDDLLPMSSTPVAAPTLESNIVTNSRSALELDLKQLTDIRLTDIQLTPNDDTSFPSSSTTTNLSFSSPPLSPSSSSTTCDDHYSAPSTPPSPVSPSPLMTRSSIDPPIVNRRQKRAAAAAASTFLSHLMPSAKRSKLGGTR